MNVTKTLSELKFVLTHGITWVSIGLLVLLAISFLPIFMFPKSTVALVTPSMYVLILLLIWLKIRYT